MSDDVSDSESEFDLPLEIIANYSYVDSVAVDQLSGLADKYSDVLTRVVALPDLHTGPVGVAIRSQKVLPELIGNDIGCGMTLFDCGTRFNQKKACKKLKGVVLGQYPHAAGLLEANELPITHTRTLGTIGGGNHFAEFMEFEDIIDSKVLPELCVTSRTIFLLVHSGSRSLGKEILDHSENMSESEYLQKHDEAVEWALANRILIAHRVTDHCGIKGLRRVLNVKHNFVEKVSKSKFVHRKGAGKAELGGFYILPGSRGSLTYLLRVTNDPEILELTENSLAHGAGRRWTRSSCESRLRKKYSSVDSLRSTNLGSRVICDRKELLYQEAPEAYKNITDVVRDLCDLGVCEIVATLRPILTFKN